MGIPRYDLICLGSGPAGEKAALMAAAAGKRVAIVEKEPVPGGAMVNTGTIASKTLRETALICSALRRRPVPGMATELDKSISLPRFMARKTMVQLEEHDRIERSIDRLGIDVKRGFGRVAGEHHVTVTHGDGCTLDLECEHLLVATGSRPFRPGHVDFNHPAIVDADRLLGLERMPHSMLAIGGGVIGSEYACIFAEMGVETTIIEPRDAIMPFLDREIRETLTAQMAHLGIATSFGRSVEKLVGTDDGAVATLSDGSELRADVVLWALGRVGNTDGIGLDLVGLVPDKRGQLTVDAHYRTSVPWIWAAGDVIGFPALASTSLEQGRIAACHMFGLKYREKLAATVPIGIYTIPAVGSVGLTEDEARTKGLDIVIGRARYRNNPRGRMLGDDQGLCKMVFDVADRKLLGASVVGEDATELIHLAQAAIAFGAGIDFFAEACFNYPSLGDLFKYAALDAGLALDARVAKAA